MDHIVAYRALGAEIPENMDVEILYREGASEEAFGWFRLYCTMPPGERSLQKMLDFSADLMPARTPSIATIKLWSSRYKWKQRVREFDRAVRAEAFRLLVASRGHTVSSMLYDDMEVCLNTQAEMKRRLSNDVENISDKDFCALVNSYGNVRKWISEMVEDQISLEEIEDARHQ